MANDDTELDKLRAEIDRIDQSLQQLINDRAAVAVKVGEVKRRAGDGAVFYRPEREAAILKRIGERNTGPLSDAEVMRLMREVMSACLALENPLRVAYLGPEATYTHMATLKHFGGSVKDQPAATIEDVIAAVEAGRAEFGVVPIENSLEGGVNQTLDALRESTLKICGEVRLPIHHQLLSRETTLDSIKIVYAHAQALAQCRRWLAANLPGIECAALNSNGEAAARAANEAGTAAIAGQYAADRYSLTIVSANIEDQSDNTTRFIVLGQQSPPPSGTDVTSLMFTTLNRPGALHDALGTFAEAGISMSRIESRPLREAAWDYVFFVDIDGHCESPEIAETIKSLDTKTSLLKILGSYPRAVL